MGRHDSHTGPAEGPDAPRGPVPQRRPGPARGAAPVSGGPRGSAPVSGGPGRGDRGYGDPGYGDRYGDPGYGDRYGSAPVSRGPAHDGPVSGGPRGSAPVSGGPRGSAPVSGGPVPGGPRGAAPVPAAAGPWRDARDDAPPPTPGPWDAVPAGPPPPATAPDRRRRRLPLVALVVVALLAAAAGTVAVVRPGPVDRWLGGATAAPAPSRTPDPSPTPVLRAAAGDAPTPSAAGVRAAVAPLLRQAALGPGVHASVVDVATGESLFGADADAPATPASTTKVLTAAAVLAARGPAYRLTTRAVAGAAPGEVVLVGGGDPTLAVDGGDQFPGAARLDRLAAQVKTALGGAEPTRVVIDTSLFTGPTSAAGWSPDDISSGQVAAIQALMTNAGRITPVHNEFGGDPRFGDPALAAGRAFARQLGLGASAVARGRAAPGARQLGVVQSPPLVHVLDWMLQQSDNVIAEAMGRQVALAAGRPADFASATAAILAELGELGLPADEAELSDASGLSRRNGISPGLLTATLALAGSGKDPRLGALFGGLPVAGWSGTLRTRFAAPGAVRAGRGVVRAKTGSLNGVNTIAGQLVTADGRSLVFAVLADRTGDTLAARAALDRIVAKLAACGC